MIFSGRPLRRLAGATSRLRGWKEEKEEGQEEEEKEKEEKKEDMERRKVFSRVLLRHSLTSPSIHFLWSEVVLEVGRVGLVVISKRTRRYLRCVCCLCEWACLGVCDCVVRF